MVRNAETDRERDEAHLFDERGKLEQSGDTLRFTSKKRTIDMSDLSAIELTGQVSDWGRVASSLWPCHRA
jgi:hypothetical protein